MSPPKPVKSAFCRRRLCLVAIAACLLLYYFIDCITDYAIYNVHLNSAGYFINTTGCHMLGLNPLPLSVLPYIQEEDPDVCTHYELLRAVTLNGQNFLRLNIREQQIRNMYFVDLSNITCTYMGILRLGDFENVYTCNETFRLNRKIKNIKVKQGVHMLRVLCQIDNVTAPIYHDVHFFMPPSQTAEPTYKHKQQPRRLSVMILGIDSISHMHYLRFMYKTSLFISSLPHVKFWGYNRVGRLSYPNLVPLLSDLSSNEIKMVCLQENDNYDNCNFIWKDFKAAGYRTSFAEDTADEGIFTQDKLGFRRQPTDYYLQPVLHEMNNLTRYDIGPNNVVHCSGRRTFSDVLNEFAYKLMPQLQHYPFFSFFWRSSGVKHSFNYAQHVDREYAKLLIELQQQGILDHTLVLLMSNHGMRYGAFHETYQGMQEESLPLLVALYPKWLANYYPQAVTNLKRNAKRLVTTYDLHAMLRDVLNLNGLRNEYIANRTANLHTLGKLAPRGISLFLPIPKIRDCPMAGIPMQYCLCHEQNKLSSKDSRAQRAARFVVRIINAQLKHYKICQRLELAAVHSAYALQRNLDVYEFDIQVRFETTPGYGHFESTVRFAGYSMAIIGDISRIDNYNETYYCMPNQSIKKYCFCLTID